MSVFSEKLSEYVAASNLKIAALAKLSGVERSFIQKMLTGERIPSDPAVLDQLASVMMLTPSQQQTLSQSYKISKMGEAVYYRRLLVKRLIEEAGSALAPPPMLRTQFNDPSFVRPDVLPIYEKPAILDTLRILMEETLSKDAPRIRAVVQPEYGACGVLLQFARSCPALSIEHIVCFDHALQYQKENKYNLSCLQTVFSFLFGACRYTPFFYHDAVSAKTGCTALFPFMIVSDTWCMLLSGDESHAVLLSGKDGAALQNTLFLQMRDVCTPMFLQSGKQTLSTDWASIHPGTSYCIQASPCFELFFSSDIVRPLIASSTDPAHSPLLLFERQLKQISLLEGTKTNISFFTMDGLESFLTTGRTFHQSEEVHSPLSPALRKELFRRMLMCTKNGTFTPYLLKPERLKLDHRLGFFAAGNQQIFCTCHHPLHRTSHLLFAEKSVAYAMCDFFEYLKETGLVFSKEETEKQLADRFSKLS